MLKNPGEVDFYYNDVFGLRKVISSLKTDEKELKEENEKLMEEVEVVEGFFMTVKEINAMSRLPEVSHFACPKMRQFIKIYRMKFYLFSQQFQEIRALMSEDEYLIDPLFLMLIREKGKVEGECKEALRGICEEFKPTFEKIVEEQKK